ncbi:MAG TPA: hypothetical protein VJY62_07455 [Bacteroidia bacterium]|nr:hypothetical protein [Bacteroidia bacterium]
MLYFALAVFAVFVCIQLSFTFYFNHQIKTGLQEEVYRQSQGEYELKIEKLNTNIFNQSVFLSGFLLNPVRNINITAPKYFASASEINLIDFNLLQFLFKKNLVVDRMEVLNPSGNIFRSTKGYYRPSPGMAKKFSIYSLLSRHIHSLTIYKTDITHADIKVYDDVRDSVPSISSRDNGLRISNLKINKSAEESGRLFLADKVDLVIRKFSFTTKDSLYSVTVEKLFASYTDSTLILDSLQLIPNYNKKQFAGKAGKQTDRVKVSAWKAEFHKMNVKSFFERNWFIAGQLKIDSLMISAYRDKNDASEQVRKKSVQQLVKNIPFYIAIDSVYLNHSLVIYEEVGIGSTKPGKISFNNLDATLTGLTNDTSLFSTTKFLNIHATCRFMNQGKLQAHYSFPLNTSEMVFDCSGKLTGMPLQAINPMLERNANVSMQAGIIDSMVFSFHANEMESKGKMKLIYHRLQMEFLNKRNRRTGALEDILSFFAHRLIIKEENPSNNEPPRLTEINYTRNPYRFIFNYSWKSILSGIKPALGIPTSKSEKIKKQRS